MRKIFLGLVLFFSLTLNCNAADLSGSLGADALPVPAEAGEVLGEIDTKSADLDSGLNKIWSALKEHFHSAFAESVRPLLCVAVIAVICAMAQPLQQGNGFDYVSFCSCLAMAAAAVGDVNSIISLGSKTLFELLDFSRALLPTLTGAAVASGAVSSAGVKYAAAAMFSELLLSLAQKLIFPLIAAYTALAVANAALGGKKLSGVLKLTLFGSKTLLKAMVVCFTAYLSLTGLLAAEVDASAVKTTKAALGLLLPVVGKTIADASESLVAGAGLIRNSVGVFGLLVILGIIVLPALQICLRYLLFKAAAAILSVIAGERICDLIDALGTAYGLILALVGTAVIFLYLSVISLIRTVSG